MLDGPMRKTKPAHHAKPKVECPTDHAFVHRSTTWVCRDSSVEFMGRQFDFPTVILSRLGRHKESWRRETQRPSASLAVWSLAFLSPIGLREGSSTRKSEPLRAT